LAAASGAYHTAFDRYEKEMRAFVRLNQALGLKSADLMRSKEKKNVLTWLLEQVMRVAPGRLLEFFINRSTRRIHEAANAIPSNIIRPDPAGQPFGLRPDQPMFPRCICF
jgi:hypothetical protein